MGAKASTKDLSNVTEKLREFNARRKLKVIYIRYQTKFIESITYGFSSYKDKENYAGIRLRGQNKHKNIT